MKIIDSHAHYGYWPTMTKCEDMILKSMEKNRVNFTLFSFDGTEFREGRTKFTSQLEGSKKALALCKKHQNKLGMLVWYRPHLEKNPAELEYFIKKHLDFIHGLKFHPYLSRMRISDQRNYPYFEIARKFNFPILVHTATDNYSKLKYIVKAAKDFPDIIFVAAHCVLESNHIEIINALKECPNLYADTAWVDMEFIKIIKQNNLMDRIMFGTDNPIDGYKTLDQEIYQNYFNNQIKLNKSDFEKLMYKNAKKVYKINL